MLSKNQRQLIRQLQQKKIRNQLKLFVVEGKKNIEEFLNSSFEIETLFCTENVWKGVPSQSIRIVSYQELESISLLKNPDNGIAIFRIPQKVEIQQSDIILALDNIRDPGNLGTIIRICDWFDIRQIICNEHSVDCYNPKVIQASMGSLTRVSVVYTDLKAYLASVKLPIYATALSGQNVYQAQLPKHAVLVMGNEANGISQEIMRMCTHQITIPRFANSVTESLNVAVASAVLISEFRRN